MKQLLTLFLFLFFNLSHGLEIIDGDTFKHNGIKYRLAYIDAPELSQKTVGYLSKQHLQRILKELDLVGMRIIATDIYNRKVVVIKDINFRMIKDGYAVVYDKYCSIKYFYSAEKEAKQNKKGIHRYNFTNPQQYRRKI